MRISAPVCLVLGTAALSGILNPAAAQSIPSPYQHIEAGSEAGPFVGYASVNTGRFGYGPRGGLLLGARWGIEVAGPISFETVVGVIPGTRDVINPGRAEGDRKVGEADVLMTSVDARFKFSFTGRRTWHSISPFLVFGGGLAFDLAPDAVDDELLDPADRFEYGTSFHGIMGAGTRWWINERLTLRGDAAFQLWRLDTPPGFATPERGFPSVEEKEWVSGLRLSMSALIRW
jgi:hypothetical protein